MGRGQIVRSKKWAEDNPEKSGEPIPTIFAKGELRSTPVVGTLPFRSSKNSARVAAARVWLAAIPKPYWRLNMACL